MPGAWPETPDLDDLIFEDEAPFVSQR